MIGRFHPLLVHLPIGILLLAAAFEVLACFRRYRKLKRAVAPMLFFGALSSTLSVVTGLALAEDGAYDERLIAVHRNTGIVTAIFSWIALFTHSRVARFLRKKTQRQAMRLFLFVPLTLLIAVTGHFGGSLTHGESYLFGDDPDAAVVTIAYTGDPDSAQFYQDVVMPILKSRCYNCHGPTKQKGELRLDSPSAIGAGGEHGAVINTLSPDSSSLYARMILPLEDEHHMPPNERAQPTSAELAIIRAWLTEGTPFDKRVASLRQSSTVKTFMAALGASANRSSILPEKPVSPASNDAIRALAGIGAMIVPVADSTNYLSVSFVNARSVGDDDLHLLLPLKEQILWLNLERSAVTDQTCEVIGQLKSLTQLNLAYTRITSSGLDRLKELRQLESLNLVGTAIDDDGLATLGSVASLRNVYCFNTSVTTRGITELSARLPKLQIDSGRYVLPSLPTDTMEFK